MTYRCMDFGLDHSEKTSGDSVITGWGTVNGRAIFVFAKDFTVFSGSRSETHAQKIIKLQDMALKILAALSGYSEVFVRIALSSGAILQIYVIMDFLAANNTEEMPEWPSFDDVDRFEILLVTLILDNPNKPYDIALLRRTAQPHRINIMLGWQLTH